MKKIIPVLLCALVLASCGDKRPAGNYKIEGKIGNAADDTKVYMQSFVGDTVIRDTTLVKGNRFEFEKKFSEPFVAVLTVDCDSHDDGHGHNHGHSHSWNTLKLYVEESTIKVNTPDSLANATVEGSELHNQYKAWTETLKPIQTFLMNENAKYRNIPAEMKATPDFRAKMAHLGDSILTVQQKLALDFIASHPDSYVSLYEVMNAYSGANIGFEEEPNKIDSVFQLLSPEVKNTAYGKFFSELMSKKKAVAAGAIAPDFTINDTKGKPVKLSDFRGKYVLIDFWASWCTPCRKENPYLVKTYEQYKNKNFTILGISVDDNKDSWLKAIEEDKLPWTQVCSLTKDHNEVGELYMVSMIPDNLLIDPDGKILARRLRGHDLNEALDKYLK